MISSEPAPLHWRIRVLMAERDIPTVRELRVQLSRVGFVISEPQLGRVRKCLPARLDTRLLAALCSVLKAQPGDLLVLHAPPLHTTPSNQTAVNDPDSPDVTRVPNQPAADEREHSFPIAGPRVRPIPKPKV